MPWWGWVLVVVGGGIVVFVLFMVVMAKLMDPRGGDR